MNKTIKSVLIVKAIALVGIGSFALMGEPMTDKDEAMAVTAQQFDGYWSLNRTYDDGSEYVVDYNMTVEGCLERMWGVEAASDFAWSCERQPDMEGQPGGLIPTMELRMPA